MLGLYNIGIAPAGKVSGAVLSGVDIEISDQPRLARKTVADRVCCQREFVDAKQNFAIGELFGRIIERSCNFVRAKIVNIQGERVGIIRHSDHILLRHLTTVCCGINTVNMVAYELVSARDSVWFLWIAASEGKLL